MLLVDQPDGRLVKYVPTFKELGFKILLIPDIEQATRFLRQTRLLSMCVLVNQADSSDRSVEFLNAVKKNHPAMPVIWVDDSGGSPNFVSAFPDLVITSDLDANVLGANLERMVCSHYYPQLLVESVQRHVVTVLSRSYHTTVTVAEAVITTHRSSLKRVNAMISFAGRHVLGHLLVSADKEHLDMLYGRILPNAVPNEADVLDLAGELCNLVLGLLKQHFEGHEMDFRMGLPFFLTGHDVVVHWKGTRPSLVLAFKDGENTMYVELCFESMDELRLIQGVLPQDIDAGDLIFL
jgi:CheY-specific phosphatase CheX